MLPKASDTQTLPVDDIKTKTLPPYNVILENDDHHSMEFVIEVLCKIIGATVERAYQLMMEAHTSGRAIVWTGSREVAELKAEQIQTFHEYRDNGRDLGPFGLHRRTSPRRIAVENSEIHRRGTQREDKRRRESFFPIVERRAF